MLKKIKLSFQKNNCNKHKQKIKIYKNDYCNINKTKNKYNKIQEKL